MDTNDPNDPNRRRLKKAKEEILAVLKKYDCAGYVVLHRPNWNEVFWDIKPSYSILLGEFPTIRIRSKLQEDHGGDKDKQRFAQEQTCQMIHGMAKLMGNHAMMFLELNAVLTAKFKPEHSEDDYIPDPPPLDKDVQ